MEIQRFTACLPNIPNLIANSIKNLSVLFRVGCGFDRFHIIIRKTEMVAQFMDEHVGHNFAERVVIILGPVVENGAAIEEYGVRQLPGLRDGPVFGKTNAGKKPHQLEGAFHTKTFKHIVFGELRHRTGDVCGERLERLRQIGQRLTGDGLDVVDKIAAVETTSRKLKARSGDTTRDSMSENVPVENVVIESAKVVSE